jgi:hypothetical protein
MVSPGLRLHFLHDLANSDRCSLESSIRYFNEQGLFCSKQLVPVTNNPVAAVQKSIGRGEPSAVRKYENVKAFTVAGKYCAWVKENEGVFWQDLSCKSDGSLHPVMKLDPAGVDEALDKPGELVLLGANGYVLIRYNIQPAPSGEVFENVRDTLFCLERGSQVWSHAYRRHQNSGPRYVPVLVGDKRVYFGSMTYGDGPSMIRAYALQTSQLLYETETIVPHTNCFYGMDDTKSYCFGHPLELLDMDGDEIILAFKTETGFRQRLATFYLINGEDGSLRQKARVFLIGPAYIRVSPNRTAFSIVSGGLGGLYRHLIKVETYSRQSNGQFAATRVDTVSCEAKLLSLDPFTGRVMTVDSPSEDSRPRCSSLVGVLDSNTHSRMQTARQTYFTFPGQCNKGLHLTAADACRITLPPRSNRARVRRPFPKVPRAVHLRFADGYRAVMECDEGTIYVFDFAPGRYK